MNSRNFLNYSTSETAFNYRKIRIFHAGYCPVLHFQLPLAGRCKVSVTATSQLPRHCTASERHYAPSSAVTKRAEERHQPVDAVLFYSHACTVRPDSLLWRTVSWSASLIWFNLFRQKHGVRTMSLVADAILSEQACFNSMTRWLNYASKLLWATSRNIPCE